MPRRGTILLISNWGLGTKVWSNFFAGSGKDAWVLLIEINR